MPSPRTALIIANDIYESQALQDLRAPAADAEQLVRVLSDPRIGGFDVTVLRNEPAHVIQAQVERLLTSAKPDEVLLLHFSCHGLKDESGDLFFASSSTSPDMLGSTAVAAEFVQRYMQRSRSRDIVLLLDCCYGGAFPAGSAPRAAEDVNLRDSFPQERPGSGRRRVVITATTAMQFALEGDQLADGRPVRPSVFTAALVDGLATGQADRDEDGWVSDLELYEYVLDKVREQNPNQTPIHMGERAGRVFLARSRRQRVQPTPLSAGLQAAMAGDKYARLGAVRELRSLLTGDDVPAAAGAHEALVKLADDDSRAVAESAREALEDAVIQPSQLKVDFGRVEQKSPPPHQVVQLLGPPVARACAPHPSHDWIQVDRETDGLDISVDASSIGPQHGSIVLKGPTGEALITIDVELFSPLRKPSPRLARKPVSGKSRTPGKPEKAPAPQSGPVVLQSLSSLQPSPSPRTPPLRTNTFQGTKKIRKAWLAAAVVALLGIGVLIWIVLPSGSASVYSGGAYKFNNPQAIAIGGSHVWIVNTRGNSVTELNASNGSLVRNISGSADKFNGPQAIAVDRAHVWVASNDNDLGVGGDSVTELDASNGSLVRVITASADDFYNVEAIASDGNYVWVANYSGDSVTELNASNGKLVRHISGGTRDFSGPEAITVDGTHVWIANNSGDSVTELNASNGKVVRNISGGTYNFNSPEAIANDGTHVWVANYGSNSVTEFNASDGSLVRTISGSTYKFSGPQAIAANGARVWVANLGNDSVTELNASDGSLVQAISDGTYKFNSPEAIANDGTRVWVANSSGNSVTEFHAG